jgi:hypothetical protein
MMHSDDFLRQKKINSCFHCARLTRPSRTAIQVGANMSHNAIEIVFLCLGALRVLPHVIDCGLGTIRWVG